MAEAKYCAFEIHGEPKYYMCPRNEYCCNFGCCVSPGFQIYHLWYYWLLVIAMFLVCSGGGWWYRYWLQGRYRTAASTITPRTPTSRSQSTTRNSNCQAQQARISYNTARNTVLLHRMWKGSHRNTNAPPYNSATASSAHYQNTSVVLNDANCPYYQLYGPPPSYETVIAQSRSKLAGSSSPKLLRSSQQAMLPNFNQCYASSYNFSPCANALDSSSFHNPALNLQIENLDTAEYLRLVQQCNTEQALRQTYCLPMDFCQPDVVSSNTLAAGLDRNSSKSEDNPEAENPISSSYASNQYPSVRTECIAQACSHDRKYIHPYLSADQTLSNISIHCPSYNGAGSSRSSVSFEPIATTSSSPFGSSYRHHNRRIQGGSLKISRSKEKREHIRTLDRVHRRLSSIEPPRYQPKDISPTFCEASTVSSYISNDCSSATATSRPTECDVCYVKSNSSNDNVISKPSTSKTAATPTQVATISTGESSKGCDNSPSTDNASTNNSNFESKRRLDRSRSLE